MMKLFLKSSCQVIFNVIVNLFCNYWPCVNSQHLEFIKMFKKKKEREKEEKNLKCPESSGVPLIDCRFELLDYIGFNSGQGPWIMSCCHVCRQNCVER